jgi:hypothetical protein
MGEKLHNEKNVRKKTKKTFVKITKINAEKAAHFA